MKFGRILLTIRVMLEWPQWKMAEALSVKVKTISAWENGRREPHPAIPRLLKILAERNGIVYEIDEDKGYMKYVRQSIESPIER